MRDTKSLKLTLACAAAAWVLAGCNGASPEEPEAPAAPVSLDEPAPQPDTPDDPAPVADPATAEEPAPVSAEPDPPVQPASVADGIEAELAAPQPVSGELTESDEFTDLSIDIDPQIAAFDPVIYAMIATEALDDVQGVRATARAEAESDPEFFRPYALDETWSVNGIAGDLISIDKAIYEYMGGAHPNSFTETKLYRKGTRQAIAPASLFTSDAEFYARLRDATLPRLIEARATRVADFMTEDEVKAELEEILTDEPGMWDSLSLVSGTDEQRFGGIRVNFAPYVIGPYAEGAYEITIPQSEFRDVLQPRYQQLFGGEPE